MQGLYNGLIAPHWNEIDKIFYGSGSELIAEANKDNILLGRYVLVKYTAIVYGQDQINTILMTPDAALDENARKWKASYLLDINGGYGLCDGVVFKKVFTGSSVTYAPIAQLSATYTTSSALLQLGPVFEADKTLTVQRFVEETAESTLAAADTTDHEKQQDANIASNANNLNIQKAQIEGLQTSIKDFVTEPLLEESLKALQTKYKQADDKLREELVAKDNVFTSEINTLKQADTDINQALLLEVQNREQALINLKNEILGEGISETFDTLVEIETWLKNSGTDITNLEEQIANEAKIRAAADSDLLDKHEAQAKLIAALEAKDSNIDTIIQSLQEADQTEATIREQAITKISKDISDLTKADSDLAIRVTNVENTNLTQDNLLTTHTNEILSLKNMDTDIRRDVDQNTLDISNLSKIAVFDVTTLPAPNDATVNTLYRLINGDQVEVWWIEILEDGTRIWQQVGSTNIKSLYWKEF